MYICTMYNCVIVRGHLLSIFQTIHGLQSPTKWLATQDYQTPYSAYSSVQLHTGKHTLI